ncbi:MAG: V-type ATPase subunit [bacterium]
MLKDAIRFSYINAKIRSLKSRLLIPSDYEKLIKAQGYQGLVESLRLTSYGMKIDETLSSFDDLIHLYHIYLFETYTKIIDSVSGNIKQLVNHLYQRYELENLKVIIRTICYGQQPEYARRLLFPVTKHATLSADELLASKDMTELIEAVKGTWYYEPLENSLYRFENEGETFPLEMALDLSYYKHLWEIVSSLVRKDKKVARTLLGIQLDALNIIWIMRFKESYRFTPEEILNYSLVNGKHISRKVRKRLAYSVGVNDVIVNLEGTPYKSFLQAMNDPEIGYIKLLQYVLSITRSNWSRYPFQIGTILDYIFFIEMEIKDLITITEGIRIGMSNDEVNKYIVHNVEITC